MPDAVKNFEQLLSMIVRSRSVWLPYQLVEEMFPAAGISGAKCWAASHGFATDDDQAGRRLGLLSPSSTAAPPIYVR